MDYKYSTNGMDFIANVNELEQNLKKLEFICKHKETSGNLLLVVTDSKEIEEKVIQQLQEFSEFCVYDISKKEDSNWREKYKLTKSELEYVPENLEEFNYLIKNHPTCIIGCEKQRKILDEIYSDENDAGAWMLYNSLFNYARDDVFYKHKSNVIIIFSDKELEYFRCYAPDYFSYCTVIDFNEMFKPVIENKNYGSLSDYYTFELHKEIILKKDAK